MGKMTYDSTLTVDFEDRVLAHLQMVVGAKLRRGESFWFSWKDDPQNGDGRTTLWINPGVAIAFKFYGSRPPAINRAWIDALMMTANAPAGLHVVPEPPEHAGPAHPVDG